MLTLAAELVGDRYVPAQRCTRRPKKLQTAPKHNAKLTPDNVREIRVLHRNGLSYQKIARRYGVAANAVRQIVLGIAWGWVT